MLRQSRSKAFCVPVLPACCSIKGPLACSGHPCWLLPTHAGTLAAQRIGQRLHCMPCIVLIGQEQHLHAVPGDTQGTPGCMSWSAPVAELLRLPEGFRRAGA